MNAPTRAVSALADVILRAQQQGRRTPMGIAVAIDAAQMAMSPETAAEHERTRIERHRYRIAWGLARTRALSGGGAADRAGARVREAQEALQRMLLAVVGAQLARAVAQRKAAELRARVTELEQVEAALLQLLPTEPCPQEGAPVELAQERAWYGVWELVAGVLGVTLPYERTAAAGKVTRDAGGITRADDEPAAELMVYRASHESIVMGLYTTRQAAYEHCEAHELRDDPITPMSWEVDEDGAAELVRHRVPRSPGSESPTGYVVTPLTVASAYDEGADE